MLYYRHVTAGAVKKYSYYNIVATVLHILPVHELCLIIVIANILLGTKTKNLFKVLKK